MPDKKKKKIPRKTKLEKQYEQLFTYSNSISSTKDVNTERTSAPQYLRTWVTYGAFEDPII